MGIAASLRLTVYVFVPFSDTNRKSTGASRHHALSYSFAPDNKGPNVYLCLANGHFTALSVTEAKPGATARDMGKNNKAWRAEDLMNKEFCPAMSMCVHNCCMK
jgi:hypothetical protein